MPSDDLVTVLIAWVVLACIPAWIASTQGRSPVTWFGLGVLLSPLIAFVAVILTAPPKQPPATSTPAPRPAVTSPAGQTERCPRCGTDRAGQQRFCPSCGLDYWQAAAGRVTQLTSRPAPTPQPSAAPPAQPIAAKSSGLPTWLVAMIATIVVLGGGYLALQAVGANLLERTAQELEDVGADGSANIPGRGEVWFGDSFDTDTFEVLGRTSTVAVAETFAVVAHLHESMVANQLVVRVLLDGQVIANEQASAATGEGELYGVTLGPMFFAGTYRFEFTDVGGNELASGQLDVTE